MNPAATQPLALDVNALAQSKRLAKEDPRAALKGAAQQVEAVFLQMVLKAMRDASPKDGLFDSEQGHMYQSLLDQQLAQVLSARGSTGLAAMIEKQLSRGLVAEQNVPLSPAAAGERAGERGPAAAAPPLAPTLSPPGGEREIAVPAPASEFVGRLWPHAHEASQATGIPAHFMIAQAALETGWGRAELRFSDGTPTYNLFGIKAGRGWRGAVAEATTTEYLNGAAQKTVERFRAYSSYAEAFRDYASLLASNPRYAGVLNQQDPAGFARGLQQAGYATDPMYAEKLERIIGGQTLRAGLTG
ncbi:MAG: flagellar assembly peptidoglycan hydrolase FlgJ [Rhodocyclaceae bacterium]|jgi:flagellar protein FlgJ|nr:flagellar assembly peptidoglycan hydrolase FlgJ [Rhodocyclaceae bacterium]